MRDEGGSLPELSETESSGPASARTKIAHDDGFNVEVGEPFCLEGGEWICVAKLIGREDEEGEEPQSPDDAPFTHTLFLAQGHGRSGEEAVRDALNQVEQVRKAPDPRIRRRSSLPPEPNGPRMRPGPVTPMTFVGNGATVPPPSPRPPKLEETPRVVVAPAPSSTSSADGNWLTRLFKRR